MNVRCKNYVCAKAAVGCKNHVRGKEKRTQLETRRNLWPAWPRGFSLPSCRAELPTPLVATFTSFWNELRPFFLFVFFLFEGANEYITAYRAKEILSVAQDHSSEITALAHLIAGNLAGPSKTGLLVLGKSMAGNIGTRIEFESMAEGALERHKMDGLLMQLQFELDSINARLARFSGK